MTVSSSNNYDNLFGKLKAITEKYQFKIKGLGYEAKDPCSTRIAKRRFETSEL